MDKKTVFVKTHTGETEVSGKSDVLFGDAKRILLLVNNKSNVGEILKSAPPSLRDSVNDVLQELVNGGYIKDQDEQENIKQPSVLKMATPAFKMATPKLVSPSFVASNSPGSKQSSAIAAQSSSERTDKDLDTTANKTDLDFSFILPTTNQSKVPAGKVSSIMEQIELAANKKQEESNVKSEKISQIGGASRTAKLRIYDQAKEKARMEVAEKARIEMELRKKNDAEAMRLKVEQEALKSRNELAAVQVKVEAEVRARIEAEAVMKKNAEAVRLKAEKDAEKIRQELAAEKTKVELEKRNRLEAEARANAEIAVRMQREAEAEQLRKEKERAELEANKIRVEAERKMRVETELRVKAEIEKRIKQEEEAARLVLEKERAELEVARTKLEAERAIRAETEMRVRAEVENRIKQEEAARLLLEKERAELEVARMKVEAELRNRTDAEARSKASEFTQNGDRRKHHQGADSEANFNVSLNQEQTDSSEKLRQSFVESFTQNAEKQKDDSLNFKLDTFSFVNTSKNSAFAVSQQANVGKQSGAVEAKNVAQAALEKAEAQRVLQEQQAIKLKEQQDEAARVLAEKEKAEAHRKAELELKFLRAEHEAARLKAEQEAAQLKAARDAEEERQKLADHQNRQWEEGRRKAELQAQAEKDRLDKQYAEAQIKSRQKRDRVSLRSFPLGKFFTSLLLLTLIAVLGLPYVLPIEEYIPPLESEIATHIGQPVKIKKIRFNLLPIPKLELSNVGIGPGQEIQVGLVVLKFDWSALFATTRSINSMEWDAVTVSLSSLENALVWMKSVGGSEKYPVALINFKGMRMLSDEIQLPVMNGKASFDGQGEFALANFFSEDGKFNLEFKSQQGHLYLELNVRQGSLPILAGLKFTDLNVNGAVTNNEIVLTDYFAHIYGGTLTGKGLLSWQSGWKLQGEVNSKSLELQSLFPAFGLTGQLYGDAKVSMSANAISQLDRDPQMEGKFEVKNGSINKLDIDTVARIGTRQGTFGHTKFNELGGVLKSDSKGQRIQLTKFTAAAISGVGTVEVDARQQLSGRLQVEFKGVSGNVPLQLSGSLSEPLLTPAH
jgi:hypothetical protein